MHNSFRLWCAYHHEHEVTYSINKLPLFIIRQMDTRKTVLPFLQLKNWTRGFLVSISDEIPKPS